MVEANGGRDSEERRYLTIHNYLIVGISLWAVFLLIVSAFKLSRVLEGADNPPKNPLNIVWRLIASQVVSGVMAQIAITLNKCAAFPTDPKISKIDIARRVLTHVFRPTAVFLCYPETVWHSTIS